MTKKQQEREALEKIRKIVEALGEDSYIGTAMAGMFEDAEENIENDFAMSWKDRAEDREHEIEALKAENQKLREMAENFEKQVKVFENECQMRSQVAQENAEDAKAWMQRATEKEQKVSDLTAVVADKDRLLANRDFEIMQLKAKLYDLMMKEEA